MEPVTYSLKRNNTNSQEYYNTIREFTNTVLDHSQKTLTPIAEEYMQYLQKHNLEKIRGIEEYILELICFGVLWETYAKMALSVRIAPFITMAYMSEWRKKHQRVKPLIDFVRGMFLTIFFISEKTKNHFSPTPTLVNIDQVCKWFESTGEFREQALRFVRWRAFWGTINQDDLNEIFITIHNFTIWFEENTLIELGKFTQNVDEFLKNSGKRFLWREDRISSTRARIEYHLNMVGAELMNRAFRKDYEVTETKAVLLPGCMRGKSNNDCNAKRVKEGLICAGCIPECNVNKLRVMGEKQNFKVYIIPHASDLSLWSPQKGMPTRGVVASACVTTLVEGGWELKRYDVPAQCVLLDYSGCKKHWLCDGVITQLDIRELKRVI